MLPDPYVQVDQAAKEQDVWDASTLAIDPPEIEEPDGHWMRGRDWAELEPDAMQRSRRASRCWSRVVRKPLTLNRHVVLDLCVAAPDQRAGALERHIVARSDRKQPWLGPAAYRLARAMSWGDLWPSVYHRNVKVTGWR
jgi:Mitochondrial small ribosomal subunit Rsm22